MQPSAETTSKSDSPLVLIEPRIITFPPADCVACVEFSADGKSLYTEIRVEMFNFRQVIRDEGDWIALGLLLPLLLGAVLCSRGQISQHRRKGERYCRHCNYEVGPTIESGGERCTECGTEFSVKRPVVGRSQWPRRASAIVLLALGIAVAFAAYSPWTKKPVTAWAAMQADASRWWYEVFRDANVPMPTTWIHHGSQLIELDVASGTRLRTITTRNGWTQGLRLMPDGTTLLADRWRSIEAIRLRDGKVIETLQWPIEVRTGYLDTPFRGFCDGGASVLLNWWPKEGEKAYLTAWTPKTGAQREVLSVDTTRRSYVRSDGVFVEYNPGAILQPIGDVRDKQAFDVLAIPQFKTFEVISGATGSRTSYEVAFNPYSRNVVLITADGAMAFGSDLGDGSVHAFSPRTGAPIGTLDVFGRSNVSVHNIDLANKDRWLLVRNIASGGRASVRIRDMWDKRWIAQLAVPSGDSPEERVVVSSDGRFAATVLICTRGAASRNLPWASELAIWDLSAIAREPDSK